MDFDSMRNHSAMLEAAYRRLAEERQAPSGQTQVLSVAAIFVGAFSVEIGLKALIVRDRRIKSPAELRRLLPRKAGHDLAALFQLLSPAKQKLIQHRLSTAKTNGESFVMMGGALADAPDLTALLKRRTFDEHLALVGTAFEQWRYNYEQPTMMVSKTFLECLIEATQAALNRSV
jgi:hypothetical protein